MSKLLVTLVVFAFAARTLPAQNTGAPSPPASESQEGSTTGDKTGANPGSPAGAGIAGANASGKPYRVGGDVKPPKVISSPDPKYSDIARMLGYQGTVVLWMVVDTDGLAKQIRVARSIGLGLDEEAIEGVKKWRFEPSTKNGVPVPVQINVEVNFRLYAPFPQLVLTSPAKEGPGPPSFSSTDFADHPVVIRVVSSVPSLAGKSYEIRASASLEGNGASSPLSLFCSGTKSHCAYLKPGYYPARWITDSQRLQILGLGTQDVQKAEYAVVAGGGNP